MNALRSLFPKLLATVLAAAGIACGPADETPTIFFDISFEGRGCDEAGVAKVRVTFENGGIPAITENCSGTNYETVVVDDLPPNTYRVAFEGIDSAGEVAYAGLREFRHTVDGSHVNKVDLDQTIEVITEFTFAGTPSTDGLTCGQARIDHLRLTVGTLVYDNVPCSTQDHDAAILVGIEAGRYDIKAEAFDLAGTRLYESTFARQTVVAAASNVFELNILPLFKGGLSIDWEFQGGGSCAELGIATVSYLLIDAVGREVSSQTVGCTQRPVLFDHTLSASALDAGLYVIASIQARAANNALVFAASSLPIYAPAGRTQGFTVTLVRQ